MLEQQDKMLVPMEYKSHAGDAVSLSVGYVRSQFCPLATSVEAYTFMATCQAHKLNPILGEVYLIKYGADSPASIVLSYLAWLQRATQDKNYNGFDAGVVLLEGDDTLKYRQGAIVAPKETLIGGWCEGKAQRTRSCQG